MSLDIQRKAGSWLANFYAANQVTAFRGSRHFMPRMTVSYPSWRMYASLYDAFESRQPLVRMPKANRSSEGYPRIGVTEQGTRYIEGVPLKVRIAPASSEIAAVVNCTLRCFSCSRICSGSARGGSAQLQELIERDRETEKPNEWGRETEEERDDGDYRATCTIKRVGKVNSRCIAKVYGTSLPIELPTAILRKCNVLKDGKFEWRMREDGEVRSEDIFPASESPTMPIGDEAELERLYQKRQLDQAEDVWSRLNPQCSDAE